MDNNGFKFGAASATQKLKTHTTSNHNSQDPHNKTHDSMLVIKQQQQPPSLCPQDLIVLLRESNNSLEVDVLESLEQMRTHVEQKVYRFFSGDKKEYLNQILRACKSTATQQASKLVNQTEGLIMQEVLMNSSIDLTQLPRVSIKQREKELLSKIKNLNRGLKDISLLQTGFDKIESRLSSPLSTTDVYIMGDYKYWAPDSEKSTEVRNFLSNMHKEQRRFRRKLEKLKQKQAKNMLEHSQEHTKQEEEEKNKRREELMKKLQEKKAEREKEKQERKEKQVEAGQVVSKFQGSRLLHEKGEERLKKMLEEIESQRKQILTERREKYKPLNAEEMEEHLQKYSEWKQKMQHSSRRSAFEEQVREKQEELAKYYRGKFHQYLEKEKEERMERVRAKSLIRQNVSRYEQQVLRSHRPQVDPAKKIELQNLIQETDNRGKRMVKKILQTGEVMYQPGQQYNSREIGKQYLVELRNRTSSSSVVKSKTNNISNTSKSVALTNGVSRKGSTETASIKTNGLQKNYLHEGVKGLRSTISKWKKDLQANNLTKDERFQLVLKKVQRIDEQAKRKEVKLKVFKNTPQALEIKESLDKYYLNSINAKLQMLDKVITT